MADGSYGDHLSVWQSGGSSLMDLMGAMGAAKSASVPPIGAAVPDVPVFAPVLSSDVIEPGTDEYVDVYGGALPPIVVPVVPAPVPVVPAPVPAVPVVPALLPVLSSDVIEPGTDEYVDVYGGALPPVVVPVIAPVPAVPDVPVLSGSDVWTWFDGLDPAPPVAVPAVPGVPVLSESGVWTWFDGLDPAPPVVLPVPVVPDVPVIAPVVHPSPVYSPIGVTGQVATGQAATGFLSRIKPIHIGIAGLALALWRR